MGEFRRTLWCGNLSDKVTEELLYELFMQVAPLERVRLPCDNSGRKSNFAFITVKHEASVDYVVRMLNGTCLYNKRINIRPRAAPVQAARTEPPNMELQLQALQNPQMLNLNSLMAMGQMMRLAYAQQTQNNLPVDRGDRRRPPPDFERRYQQPQPPRHEPYNRESGPRRDNRSSSSSSYYRNNHRNSDRDRDRNRRPRHYH